MSAPAAIIGVIEAPEHYRLGILRELASMRAAKTRCAIATTAGRVDQAEREQRAAIDAQGRLIARITDATGLSAEVLREALS